MTIAGVTSKSATGADPSTLTYMLDVALFFPLSDVTFRVTCCFPGSLNIAYPC